MPPSASRLFLFQPYGGFPGEKEGFADIELESVTEGKPGKVDLVPPFNVHAKRYFQGEGPTQVPFEIS